MFSCSNDRALAGEGIVEEDEVVGGVEEALVTRMDCGGRIGVEEAEDEFDLVPVFLCEP